LLENGSNTSFVHKIVDESIDVEDIVADPLAITSGHDFLPHPRIPRPLDIFQPERDNSHGFNLADRNVSRKLRADMDAASERPVTGRPIIGGKEMSGSEEPSVNPANIDEIVGICHQAAEEHVDAALDLAITGQVAWDRTPADERAAVLNRVADLFEAQHAELMALCVNEGGRTIPDTIAELREAVDFLRYYAAQSRRHFGAPLVMPGPTGERNTYGLRGRGVFLCISPWNFPLAIFTGQIAAALAAGNAVLAKPAAPTPLIAYRAVQLMLEAGVPADVLHFIPGDGRRIGGRAV
jgi:RHH-type proline utilization regulon transcriptional repressor/proline dehydrogenase/delta 1-pyrroline-5-carboxylate dehydrogenase